MSVATAPLAGPYLTPAQIETPEDRRHLLRQPGSTNLQGLGRQSLLAVTLTDYIESATQRVMSLMEQIDHDLSTRIERLEAVQRIPRDGEIPTAEWDAKELAALKSSLVEQANATF